MRYLDKLKTVQAPEANDPLILGTCLHTGIEKSIPAAIAQYYGSFPVATDRHIEEAVKLEAQITKARELVPDGFHELKLMDFRFIGYIDLLAPATFERVAENETLTVPDVFDLYDFKYSNNTDHYLKSRQLHLYKYFFEKTHPGKTIRNLYFLMVPKVSIKPKQGEELFQFRERIQTELQKSAPKLVPVEYNPSKIIEHFELVQDALQAQDFPKEEGFMCNYCEYKDLCLKGLDYMILPENKKKAPTPNTTPDMWLYAQSYVGKTTFVDSLDDVLFLNTDGNIDSIQNPCIRIKDEIIKEGRMTKTVMAWDVFLSVLDELEKKDSTFKIVCIDLIEDLYEHCRLAVYKKNGWNHESDAGYGKGWDMVKTEFLSNIKRLKNMGYQVIYISKEISGEVKNKGGGSVTTYAPNIPAKVANVLAGTVDLTARAYADEKGRFLSFKADEYVFGGSRFNLGKTVVPLDKAAFLAAITGAQEAPYKATSRKKEVAPEQEEKPAQRVSDPKAEEANTPEPESPSPADEHPVDDADKSPFETEQPKEEPATDMQPTRRTRRVRK